MSTYDKYSKVALAKRNSARKLTLAHRDYMREAYRLINDH